MIDDFGLAPLSDQTRRELLEIVDDRHDKNPRFSPAICLWISGIPTSTNPPLPMRSSIASCTRPIGLA